MQQHQIRLFLEAFNRPVLSLKWQKGLLTNALTNTHTNSPLVHGSTLTGVGLEPILKNPGIGLSPGSGLVKRYMSLRNKTHCSYVRKCTHICIYMYICMHVYSTTGMYMYHKIIKNSLHLAEKNLTLVGYSSETTHRKSFWPNPQKLQAHKWCLVSHRYANEIRAL